MSIVTGASGEPLVQWLLSPEKTKQWVQTIEQALEDMDKTHSNNWLDLLSLQWELETVVSYYENRKVDATEQFLQAFVTKQAEKVSNEDILTAKANG